VTVVDTGEDTMTGGRLKRVGPYLDGDDCFCFTYGDGVGDIDIAQLIDFHRGGGKLAAVTATQPPGRFGVLDLEDDRVRGFKEQASGEGSWINSGFFVLSTKVLHYIEGDDTVWEQRPIERLAQECQMQAWRHHGFWRPMDTLRDKNHLEDLWATGRALWKVWP
jgi:glucose-1-phosphate cytidylyltransferase